MLGEGQVGVSSPPDDQLGGEPGPPADEVHHQHQDQHLEIISYYTPNLFVIQLDGLVQCSKGKRKSLSHLYDPPPPSVYSCCCCACLTAVISGQE